MKKKLRFDVYLSLGMHGRLGRDVIEQIEEAKKLCKMYDVTYYAPTDDEVVNPNAIIDSKPNMRRMRWFVAKDDGYIDVCRGILVLTGDRSSSGTLWEAGRMYYRHRRPVFLVAPRMYHRQLANFSTVKAAKVFNDMEQAIRWISRHDIGKFKGGE
jgi:nucleoside 2-deoxyribosyltransferase